MLTEEQAQVIKNKEHYGIDKHNGLFLLWKNDLTSSYMEKYNFSKEIVFLSL